VGNCGHSAEHTKGGERRKKESATGPGNSANKFTRYWPPTRSGALGRPLSKDNLYVDVVASIPNEFIDSAE
jgi:hypothetical protein